MPKRVVAAHPLTNTRSGSMIRANLEILAEFLDGLRPGAAYANAA